MTAVPVAPLPLLHTPRLVLRPPAATDINDLIPISFYQGKPAANRQEALEMLQKIDLDVQEGRSLHWGMALKESNRIIGTCGFYRGIENQTGEIGYVLLEEQRRKGFTLEAVQALMKYGFGPLQLLHIFAYTDPENTPSIDLLLKAGFTETASAKPGLKAFISSASEQ